ncbi:hypothetical protein RHSIM_Rhsim10G0154700 [Rhododendron simsii]|uniref:Uncharacterized protein n=1 Tax=Rhododendron simsii TaxID=118357 RepID=A0A834GEU3_RHOSS|nr:hypothetical protein RHSIM_Rhsim10G0154700 [Rhododendron simsii]
METDSVSSASTLLNQTSLTCAGGALTAVLVSALVNNTAQDLFGSQSNIPGVKGEDQTRYHSKPSDAEGNDANEDDDDEDGGYEEGEEDLSSEDVGDVGNNGNNSKSDPKKGPGEEESSMDGFNKEMKTCIDKHDIDATST